MHLNKVKSLSKEELNKTKFAVIELGKCEELLKENYYLNKKEQLFVIVKEQPSYNSKVKSNFVSYEVDTKNGAAVNINKVCKDDSQMYLRN